MEYESHIRRLPNSELEKERETARLIAEQYLETVRLISDELGARATRQLIAQDYIYPEVMD